MLPCLLALFSLLTVSAFAQGGEPDSVSANCAPSLKLVEVPRDERRQQILMGIHETRFAYTLSQVPPVTTLFAECYLDGRMTRRLQLVSANQSNNAEYANGVLSLGWNYLTHALTLINDNGFGLWNSRVPIAPEVMSEHMVVVEAEHPEPELRDTVNDYPAAQVTIYPIIGLIGPTSDSVAGHVHFELTTGQRLLKQAAAHHSSQCIIIYLYGNAGGNPPFKFDEKAGFYVNSLPIN